MAGLLAGCVSQQRGLLVQHRQIPVITDAVLPHKYTVLGTITADGGSAWGNLDRNSANAAISVAAQQKYGLDVDAVIEVKYSAITGSAYGTTIGTRATGTAVRYER